jgi:hypothetical protein
MEWLTRCLRNRMGRRKRRRWWRSGWGIRIGIWGSTRGTGGRTERKTSSVEALDYLEDTLETTAREGVNWSRSQPKGHSHSDSHSYTQERGGGQHLEEKVQRWKLLIAERRARAALPCLPTRLPLDSHIHRHYRTTQYCITRDSLFLNKSHLRALFQLRLKTILWLTTSFSPNIR